ncbi:hypothetical protein [Streptomyces sp. NPDC056291]|uniref:hypothetical protein n=1 Tax=Streptomyces sp. NPDC056291 TaxID=3345772 RepID=UPI0035DD724C
MFDQTELLLPVETVVVVLTDDGSTRRWTLHHRVIDITPQMLADTLATSPATTGHEGALAPRDPLGTARIREAGGVDCRPGGGRRLLRLRCRSGGCKQKICACGSGLDTALAHGRPVTLCWHSRWV